MPTKHQIQVSLEGQIKLSRARWLLARLELDEAVAAYPGEGNVALTLKEAAAVHRQNLQAYLEASAALLEFLFPEKRWQSHERRRPISNN